MRLLNDVDDDDEAIDESFPPIDHCHDMPTSVMFCNSRPIHLYYFCSHVGVLLLLLGHRYPILHSQYTANLGKYIDPQPQGYPPILTSSHPQSHP